MIQQDSAAIGFQAAINNTDSQTDSNSTTTGIDLREIFNDNYFSRQGWRLDSVPAKHNVGVEGTPLPYSIRTDNVLTLVLIASFVLFVFSLSHSKRFIVRQMKSFIYLPHTDRDTITETASELRFQIFLVFVNCLVLAITAYMFGMSLLSGIFFLGNGHLAVLMLFVVFVLFFMSKTILYSIVNIVFFGGKKNLQMMKSLLFITASEGVLLFPLVLLLVYFDLSVENALYYFGFVLILNKILTFYKSWLIFFRRKNFFLHIFLYFCALEIIPLLALAGGGLMIKNYFEVNF